MQIEIGSKNLELTPGLTVYIEEKMGALSKHVQKFEQEGELQLKMHVGRITAHHHKGEVYEASADLNVPGGHLRAHNESEDVHTAIDAVRDILAQEIEKYKAKHS